MEFTGIREPNSYFSDSDTSNEIKLTALPTESSSNETNSVVSSQDSSSYEARDEHHRYILSSGINGVDLPCPTEHGENESKTILSLHNKAKISIFAI